MTREHKLALIVGFALVLVVGVLVSDHFSSARKSQPRSGIMALGPQEAGADVPQPTIASSVPPAGGYGTSGLRDWPVAMPPTNPPDPTYADNALTYTDPTSVIAPSGTDRTAPIYQPGVTVPGGMPSQSPPPVTVVMGPQGGGTGVLPHNGALVSPDRTWSGGVVQPTGTGSSIQDFVPVGSSAGPMGASGASSSPPPVIVPEPTVPSTPSMPVSTGKVQKRSVKEGETLYGLAEEFYGDANLWTKLRDFNKGKIGSNGAVREGVTLTFPPKDVLLGKAVLPGQGGAQPASRPSPSVPGSPSRTAPSSGSGTAIVGVPASAGTGGKTYTMQKGDVLSLVAKKTLGSARRWQEIVDANPGVIDDPDSIPAGTVLKIPAR